jgi:hypothetical protein
MAQSLLVQQLLQQLLSGQGQQMLSPLAPVGKLALAAAMKQQQKKQESKDNAQVQSLADVLATPAPTQFQLDSVDGAPTPYSAQKKADPATAGQFASLAGGDPRVLQQVMLQQMQGQQEGQQAGQQAMFKAQLDSQLQAQKDAAAAQRTQETNAARIEAAKSRGPLVTNTFTPGGNMPLTSANETAIQQKILAGRDQLANLRVAGANFNPMFLTYKGQFDMTKLKARDLTKGIPVVEGLLGGKLNPEQKQLLGQFTTWQQSSYETLNQGIKEMTGASMGVTEADRLRKQFPDPEEDSPEQYVAKYNGSVRRLSLADARARMAAKDGVVVATADDLVKYKSLDDVQKEINDRGNQILEELKAKGIPDAEAKKQMLNGLQAEFGVVF